MRCLAFVLLLSASAYAAPERLRIVGADNACPSPRDVAERLRPLLPTTRIVDDADAVTVELFDDGPRYRVVVAGTTRVLGDPEQRCDDRADAAAVSIALVLAPPPPPVKAPTPPAPPPPAPTPLPKPLAPPRPPPDRKTHIDIELDGRMEGSGSSGPSGGGGARLAITNRHVGGSIGIAGISPVTFALDSARKNVGAMSITRVPFDLSFRGGHRFSRVELNGELGFVAQLEVVRGEQVTNATTRTSADYGLRFAISARAWLSRRVALFAAFDATVIPSPIDIGVHNDGVVSNTPNYWLGGSLGLVLRAR